MPDVAQYIREVNFHLRKIDNIIYNALVYGTNRETAMGEVGDCLFKAKLYNSAAMRELGEEMYIDGVCSPRIEDQHSYQEEQDTEAPDNARKSNSQGL